MRMSPVYKRETTVSSRSYHMVLTLVVFNGILALVALLNMYSTIAQVRLTAEIEYSNFLNLYAFVATIEFILLLFIMPAITSGAISGERERQTLDLMLTTKLTPAELVLGKLAVAFSTMLILILSSFPILALVFVYGGVTGSDMLLLLLCDITAALFAGSVGICCSSVFKKSTIATVVSYGILVVMVAGTYAINLFMLSLSKMSAANYAAVVNMEAQVASSGSSLYFLLFNPSVTFLLILNGQSSSTGNGFKISQWFGTHPENFITVHWIPISIAIQLIFVTVLLAVAVKAISNNKR